MHLGLQERLHARGWAINEVRDEYGRMLPDYYVVFRIQHPGRRNGWCESIGY